MKAVGWRWAVLLASVVWLGWMGRAQTNVLAGTNTVVMAPLTNGVKSNIGLLVPVGPEPMAPGSFSGDLRRMKAAWQQRLVLGPGDVVTFMVYGKPELTRPDVQVEPDGRITYLEAQGMMATGLTIPELRELTEKELSKSYRNPRVMVVPTSWKSKKFHILGKVVNKGTYLLDRRGGGAGRGIGDRVVPVEHGRTRGSSAVVPDPARPTRARRFRPPVPAG